MAIGSQELHSLRGTVALRTNDMSGDDTSPARAATAHQFAALDSAAEIHLGHDSNSEATAKKETCNDTLHQKRREEADKAMESERIKVEEARRDSALSDPNENSSPPPRDPEETSLVNRHGKYFKFSHGGAKIFFSPLKTEFNPTTPPSDSTNKANSVTKSMTEPVNAVKGLSPGPVMEGANTTVPTVRSAILDKSISGTDNLEIPPKPHPYFFNITGKRPPTALVTGKVIKKPKGVVKNIVHTALYPDSNNSRKDPVIDEVETTVAQAGEVAGEENELEVPIIDYVGLCAEVENVLNRMFEVAKHMFEFREYLAAENNSKKPLYQWDKYASYPKLHLATVELEKTAGRLETVGNKIRQTLLPRKYVTSCLDRALNLSTSTSKSVAFASNTMSVRSATCMDEIANSSLDEAGRDIARIVITGEIGELLKHSTAATNSVYAAMDLLRTSLHSEIQDDNGQDAKPCEHTKRGSWKYGAILSLSLFSIGLTSFGQFGHLLPTDWVPGSWIPSNRISGMQIPNGYTVVDITSLQTCVHDTINSVAEMNVVDNKVTSTRLKHLEQTHEATGQRIDNIWDALGPPGPDGRYKFESNPGELNDDSAWDIQKVREEVKTQLDRVNHEIAHLDKIYEEIVDLRRHVHRVDLRLTKRIDQLPGGRT